jgi:phosphinothricin acetyltransferase
VDDDNVTIGPGPISIGPGTEADLPGIVAILNHTAAHTIGNLDTRPIDVTQRREWFSQFAATGPYRLFVARRGTQVVGYVASQRYREHPAFRETVEVSVSLDVSCRGQGLGTALYRVLFEALAGAPVHVALAAIAVPNPASMALHRRHGFTEIGTFREYAIKNGQYISSVWLQRVFEPGGAQPGGARPGGVQPGGGAPGGAPQ